MLLKMAADAPVIMGTNVVLKADADLTKIEAEAAKLALARKAVRATLKDNKIELRVFDHVRKIKKMDPEDQRSFKATDALYTQQMGMELSPAQETQLKILAAQREQSRKDIVSLSGGDTGKEIGSHTGSDDDESHEVETTVPAKNESIAAARIPLAAVLKAH